MSPILILIVGMIAVLAGILLVRLHPVLALLGGAVIVGFLTSPYLLQQYAESKSFSPQQLKALLDQSTGERIAKGFGNTCERVGLLILLASITGKCLYPVYLAAVIGCGSKIVPWMNDAGFWIVCKMCGFTERETFHNDSMVLVVMGITGLVFTMLLAKLFPMI